jgi:hypothetical protein
MITRITREVFWSWSEERRDSWAAWFEARGYPLDVVAEFTIDSEALEVEAAVYTLLPRSTATELVTLQPELIDTSSLADPDPTPRMSLPGYG